MDLFEDGPAAAGPDNAPPLTVSEISGAVKRVIEGEFSRVRVRGEIGRVSRPGSGHLYFDLKDDRAVIASVCWKGTASRLTHRPEEGMEVIATGRLTTFPGQSRYQLLVEDVEPAGLGALMAMLDARRRQLGAEGLFDPARKRPIPFLPGVIAVVTSPSGAVIRDILHRLRDRFPSRVIVYPVAVQGRDCAPQVAAAIRALNALPAGGAGGGVPRPDLIIVARGGGSVEDLWGFNEEIVVRAAADGTIPLISAVGHETDTTLIDHAADLRAPTPTAAAELAVPVRGELAARLVDAQGRMIRAAAKHTLTARQRLGDLSRGLGRPQTLTEGARQRFDLTAPRIEGALRGFMRDRRRAIASVDLPIFALRQFTRTARGRHDDAARRLALAPARVIGDRRRALPRQPVALLRRPAAQARVRLTDLAARLDAARNRTLAQARRDAADRRAGLAALALRLGALGRGLAVGRRDRLAALDRLRQTLGYTETLRRGFAVVRGPDGVVTSAAVAANAPRLDVEFHDGTVPVRPVDAPGPAPKSAKPKSARPGSSRPRDGQKSLF